MATDALCRESVGESPSRPMSSRFKFDPLPEVRAAGRPLPRGDWGAGQLMTTSGNGSFTFADPFLGRARPHTRGYVPTGATYGKASPAHTAAKSVLYPNDESDPFADATLANSERNYMRGRTAPLGRAGKYTFRESGVVPPANIVFGRPTTRSDSARSVVNPSTPPSTAQVAPLSRPRTAMHMPLSLQTEPGLQTRQSDFWRHTRIPSPDTHRFGQYHSYDRHGEQTARALDWRDTDSTPVSTRANQWYDRYKPQLGRSRFPQSLPHSVHPDSTRFGHSVLRDPFGAGALIHHDTPEAKAVIAQDTELELTRQKQLAEKRAREIEGRVSGIPSMRSDIERPSEEKRSVTDQTNYGDELVIGGLVGPSVATQKGVEPFEEHRARTEDELWAIVQRMDCGITQRVFRRAYDRAALETAGAVTPRALLGALSAVQSQMA